MAFPCNIHLFRCIALILSLAPWFVHASAPTVEVNGTDIIGTVQTSADNTTVEFFGGIPFAQPPVGALRFAPPAELDSLGVPMFNATTFGAPCVQPNVEGVSEDCLTLNVFRPAESALASDTLVPVMIWIYGGGFDSGLSAAYDATNIVIQSLLRGTPVIYVSVNYRVGPFGFPQGTEAGLLGAVNLGLQDQLAAIAWVQKHISAFGGDPTKVTLFGQDAGAMSIGHLLLNAGLENYGVRGVIMESGSAGSLPLFNASQRNLVWDAFAANISACAGVLRGSTFPCLRSAPTSALLSSWEAAAAVLPDLDLFVPVLDGPNGLIPDLPSALLAAGRVSKIPFISGTVLDEGTVFVPQALSNPIHLFEFFLAAEIPYPQTYRPQFRQDFQKLLIQYISDPDMRSPFGTGNETFGTGDLYKLWAAGFGDIVFEAPRREWTQAGAGAGVTVYSYIFADQNVAVADPSLGVHHGSEVPYVYGLSNIGTSSLESVLVSRAMVDYWLSFVVSGTPNDGKGLARTIWPSYESDNQVLIQFDTTSISSGSSNATFAIVPDDYRAGLLSFINSVATDFNR
ncbi:hypothetical protein GSI_12065 [Ganoderma sinense ZZ0214-1]|uniref:Carboxylesterase type B domain-containing protein n=1 Tax=Ganoderma sinense ZZ0214-1 TaxID=1077348 RepID=A0A2G8RXR2_9APHY|nr:hypothetical protein GSI_12065 [Ganoderma sinense ZZ0214-1]